MGLWDSQSVKGQMYESFTPEAYNYERNALNPMIWGTLAQQMKGEPTIADWQNRNAGMRAIQQQYRDTSQAAGMDFGARGLGDSGWQSQRQGQLLGGRAGSEANVMNQFFQNILARQMQATGQAGGYLAGARAGSGTYTTKEWV